MPLAKVIISKVEVVVTKENNAEALESRILGASENE